MPLPTFFNLPPEKRRRILDCAIDEFAANDYDSASISQVVARASIAKGSLYQYFADKNDLYGYLLELAAGAKADLMKELPANDAESSIFERLERLFRIMMEFELRHPKLAKIGSRAVYGGSPLPSHIITRSKMATRRYFAALVEEGKQHGEIRPELDAEVAALVFTSTLAELGSDVSERQSSHAEHQQDRTAPSEAEIERIYREVLAILQKGMVSGSVPGRKE